MTPIRREANITPEASSRFPSLTTLYQQMRNIFQRSSPVIPYSEPPVAAPIFRRPFNRNPALTLREWSNIRNEAIDRRYRALMERLLTETGVSTPMNASTDSEDSL